MQPVQLGVIGLGRAFMLTLPALKADASVRLVAACDIGERARSAFETEFGRPAYDTVEMLCRDSQVEAVYIASPHGLHAEHVAACAAAGKHVMVEKPLSLSIDDAQAMIQACREAGTHLIVGPSHSFDAPVAQARQLIDEGTLGRVRMINAFNYTDFLYRPRRPEELQTELGGGVIFSQAIHQVDVVRYLAGQPAHQVTAMTGAWDPTRPTEGAYAGLIAFQSGAFASLIYSGYGHFDSDEWQGWIGELGQDKDPDQYGKARRTLERLDDGLDEAQLKAERTYGAAEPPAAGPHHEHFGPVIVSCEAGDIRLTPDGLWIYRDREREFQPAPQYDSPRAGVIQALVSAVRDGRAPSQVGEWGLASLEICHAMLESADSGQPVTLQYQIPTQHESRRTQ